MAAQTHGVLMEVGKAPRIVDVKTDSPRPYHFSMDGTQYHIVAEGKTLAVGEQLVYAELEKPRIVSELVGDLPAEFHDLCASSPLVIVPWDGDKENKDRRPFPLKRSRAQMESMCSDLHERCSGRIRPLLLTSRVRMEDDEEVNTTNAEGGAGGRAEDAAAVESGDEDSGSDHRGGDASEEDDASEDDTYELAYAVNERPRDGDDDASDSDLSEDEMDNGGDDDDDEDGPAPRRRRRGSEALDGGVISAIDDDAEGE